LNQQNACSRSIRRAGGQAGWPAVTKAPRPWNSGSRLENPGLTVFRILALFVRPAFSQ